MKSIRFKLDRTRRVLFLSSCLFVSMISHAQDALSQMLAQPRVLRCCAIIKYYETWHDGQNTWPYVGWGHRVQPGEHLSRNITRAQGDSLLYEDLRKLLVHYKPYGERYALILSTLAYNVGQKAIDGGKGKKQSRLLQKIKQGRNDIESEYLEFCHWNGKVVKSIFRRRQMELLLLYYN